MSSLSRQRRALELEQLGSASALVVRRRVAQHQSLSAQLSQPFVYIRWDTDGASLSHCISILKNYKLKIKISIYNLHVAHYYKFQ